MLDEKLYLFFTMSQRHEFQLKRNFHNYESRQRLHKTNPKLCVYKHHMLTCILIDLLYRGMKYHVVFESLNFFRSMDELARGGYKSWKSQNRLSVLAARQKLTENSHEKNTQKKKG